MGLTATKKHKAKWREGISNVAEKPQSDLQISQNLYLGFDQLDGRHPWQSAVPEGYVLYPVRMLNLGEVIYFNFELAVEMGLIPKSHPHKMNKTLHRKLIETFSLRIVNEFDQSQNLKVHPKSAKKHPYMATRYLQLQHPSKLGTTSGDGRGIWNGCVSTQNETWDVSSRGTGVTCLAPGSVKAGKPLASGDFSHGYGCGTADVDELLGAAIMAEIFHRRGIKTERVLAIIDLGNGLGIGVRAAKNLLRPAHLFALAKQGHSDALKRGFDYFIKRQAQNRDWPLLPASEKRFRKSLHLIATHFAHFVAQLEREFIFAWLDWDGDNVLADAGIIDYGSVRQFGLRHDNYRYDDVERFSTNLNEQKSKAKILIQTFCQAVDLIEHGKKKPLSCYRNHPEVIHFEKEVRKGLVHYFMSQLGWTEDIKNRILKSRKTKAIAFYECFVWLERLKTRKKTCRVPDGINRPAILNMRKAGLLLAQNLQTFIETGKYPIQPPEVLFKSFLCQGASRRDARPGATALRQIQQLQTLHKDLVEFLFENSSPQKGIWRPVLRKMLDQCSLFNREDRLTGNALIHIVDHTLERRKKGMAAEDIQVVIDEFIHSQTALHLEARELKTPKKLQQVFKRFLSLVKEHSEDI